VLLRFLDLGASPDDDPDLQVRKRTAVAVSLTISFAGLAYAAMGIFFDRPATTVFAVIQIIGQLGNLWVFGRTKRLVPMVAVTIILGLGIVFSGILTLGGIADSGGNAIWVLIAPLGAVLLLGGRAGLPVFALAAAVVIVGALLDPVIPPDLAPGYPVVLVLMVVNILAPAAIALGLVQYIDEERLRARRQSDELLVNVLPEPIADRLKGGERVIADHYEAASVLFADIVDFTPISEAKPPRELVAILNGLFTEFDRLADRFGLEKIKTIGDAYMVVAGVPQPREDHAAVAMEMALAMHARVAAHPGVDGRRLEIRTGIASGPMVAGVIGERKFSYDLWGDTVNTASRMESSGIPGCIQVTEETCRLLAGRYPFERRDGVEIKGKGLMTTWTLDPSRNGDRPADGAR
jgi:class 3 adenylate cyclase